MGHRKRLGGLGVVAQGIFADAKRIYDPFVGVGDTELVHLRCF